MIAFLHGRSGWKTSIQLKGWFSSSDAVIQEGEGSIQSVSWRTSLIAWANPMGVKIFDFEKKQRISFIERPKPRSQWSGIGEYRCCMHWEADDTLLLAWADCWMVVRIVQREVQRNQAMQMTGCASDLPLRYAKLSPCTIPVPDIWYMWTARMSRSWCTARR